MGYYFYLPKDHNVIVNRHVIFLEKKFIQDEGCRRKIELEDVSEEHQVQEPEPSNEPVDVVPPPSRRSSRISHPPERYLDILIENLEEAFLVRDRDIKNDPKTYDEVMSDVDFEKWMKR